ncbi:helicase SNF2 [Microbacterium sp. CH12i]|uniref:DEAD/DEAH box helicase n=1 Tax=Microbacterium sp. CH12i TaxID=1479651 RepID=UPI0004613DB2|nr:DEAD/DEAH box helicase [Microbacterium sp. CH12i]KDA05658.1 helicase SNF2 [Microbacterium sp. CH12i]
MIAPHIDLSNLLRVTDSGSVDRGRSYARGGMVIRSSWNDDYSALSADVRGSGDAVYRCVVRLTTDTEIAQVSSASCNCPVQLGCKHIVAVVLTSNETRERESKSAGPEPEAEPTGPTWRTLLDIPTKATGAVALALGVEVRHRAARGIHQWAPRPVRPATVRDVVKREGELLLGIRPLMQSTSTGSWIQGGASWDAVRRPGTQFRAEQVRWFTELLSICRDSLLSGTAGDSLVLDQVESGLLWTHLRTGAEIGIPLVSAQKGFTVSLASSGSVAAQVERVADGGLSVTADVNVDGRSIDAEAVHTIGRSGIYTVVPFGARAQVTLADVPLSPIVHALINARTTLAVPEADEAAFVRDAYPALARQVPVRAVGAVTLPPVPVPIATLAVAHHPGDRISYAFEWAYRGYGRFSFAATDDTVRDETAEQEARRDVEALWQSITGEPFQSTGSFHDIEAAEFVTHIVTALEEGGIAVVVTGERKTYRELSGDPEITVSTVESADSDWFDLGILVKIDGHTIPFAPLFTALSMRRTKLLLVDGSYFSLAHPALDTLRELIDEAGELAEWETGPRISRYQTSLWEEFEDLADEALPATSWRASAEGLRVETGVPPTALPAGLHAELRPYQKAGFDWLAFLWRHRLGGILADDMGLGKTLQLLTLMLHARETGERRPFLVIAPTSVLPTWQEEAARFAPGLRVRVIDSSQSKRERRVADAVSDADVIVTSYTLARLGEEEFAAVSWAALILDEAQFVKNPTTKQHRAVASLRADATFVVTGTPMENSLSEIWALLKLAAPGLFPSARKFRQEYIQPIEQGKVPENEEGSEYRQRRLERLRRRIRPLMLRRTKELVAPDLPAKQEQLLHVELSPAHRAIYDTVLQRERQKVLGLLKDLDRNRFIVFRSLTMLRMLSLAPGLVDEADAKLGSRKLDTLVERVTELQAEGHRALVFSQFTSFLKLAAERLERAGIAYVYLDGSTRRRREVIDEFRGGEQPVFLISLKAGGFGLTLTEADYVFMLDPWWNPAAEAQAVDRTHRIGQDKQVFVYRMISTGTIEEKVLALQQRKARLFTAVLDDEALFAQALTADDIRGLFDA